MEHSAVVEMCNITKGFGPLTANDSVDLRLYAGEVHALLGENGAGKSTLMNILSGVYQPDEGQIYLNGQPTVIDSPRTALAAGIAMVHQRFRLVESLTVAENVFLGAEPGYLIRRGVLEANVAALARKYGLAVDPQARVARLSMGERQRVEILKALMRDARILILDEPTAVLTPFEADELFKTLRSLAGSGVAVVVVTHKLQEVMGGTDRITVLRAGRSVHTLMCRDTTPDQVARLMVGDLPPPPSKAGAGTPGAPRLELRNVTVAGGGGRHKLRDVSLTVRAGEILGVAGVAGNGQSELAELATGLRTCLRGSVVVSGQDCTNKGPAHFIRARVAHVPEDRSGVGVVGSLSIYENTVLKQYRDPQYSPHGLMDYRRVRAHARELLERFNVKAAGIEIPISFLSGGNLQKVIVARELSTNPEVMVAVHPTHGLDLGATDAVHSLLLRERDAGMAILLISEDLDEVLALSDRVVVLYNGEVSGTDMNREKIGLLMMGAHRNGGEDAV